MDSRKITYLLFIVLIVFVVNVVLFYSHSAYRDFLIDLKTEKQSHETPIIISDEYGLYSPSPEDVRYVDQEEDEVLPEVEQLEEIISEGTGTTESNVEIKNDFFLTKDDTVVLNKFADFNLKRIFEHPSLFDVTNEYPDEYYEYVGGNIILYFFTTKSYTGVYDVFDALSNTLPYSINETNSFLDRSFYINLDEEFKDDNVRLVIENKKRVFGLKIKKDTYNQVKQILNDL